MGKEGKEGGREEGRREVPGNAKREEKKRARREIRENNVKNVTNYVYLPGFAGIEKQDDDMR